MSTHQDDNNELIVNEQENQIKTDQINEDANQDTLVDNISDQQSTKPTNNVFSNMCYTENDDEQSGSFIDEITKISPNKYKRKIRKSQFEQLDQSLNESFFGELERTLKLEKIEEGEGVINNLNNGVTSDQQDSPERDHLSDKYSYTNQRVNNKRFSNLNIQDNIDMNIPEESEEEIDEINERDENFDPNSTYKIQSNNDNFKSNKNLKEKLKKTSKNGYNIESNIVNKNLFQASENEKMDDQQLNDSNEMNDSNELQDSQEYDSMVIRENQQPKACLHFLAWVNVLCCAKSIKVYPEKSQKRVKEHHHHRIKSLYMFVGDLLYKQPQRELLLNYELHDDSSCSVNELFQNKSSKLIHKVNFSTQLRYNQFNNFSFHVFIRHSERADQAGELDLVKVKCDSPLSKNGFKLAKLAAKIMNVKINNLIDAGFEIKFQASPQMRCLQTCLCQIDVFRKENNIDESKIKIHIDINIRETQNIINQKQYNLDEDQNSNTQPYHKLLLYNGFNQIEEELKKYGLSKDILVQPTIEEINNQPDSHILIEDAEMCILRAQKTLKQITDQSKNSFNIQFTHKNTLSSIGSQLKNEFYFKNKFQCESDYQAQNEQFQSANKFFEKVYHDSKSSQM